MGDQAEYGAIMREHRQKKHREWKRKNTRVIKESGIPYLDRGETFWITQVRLSCRKNRWHIYRLISGRLYLDGPGLRTRIVSFCLDHPEQGPVIELPIFRLTEAS